MTAPRHQPPKLDAGDLKPRRKVVGAALRAAMGQAKGTRGLPSLARIQGRHRLVVG